MMLYLQNNLHLSPEILLFYLNSNYYDVIFVNFLLYHIYSIKHILLGSLVSAYIMF
jgi:hypothetical protein